VDGAAAERALAAAGGGRFTLSVLGVGTTEGAPIPDAAGGFAKAADGSMVMSRLDRDALRRLATAGGGLYLDLGPDDSEIARLAARLETVDSERSERLEELAANQWREFGPWLLLALLPLAACAFRRGFIAVLAVAVLPLATTPARADWWRTDDQAGAAAFAAERYDEAAARFASPAWQSSAHYRAGEYEQAAAALADATDADALYNRGNALARLGRYDEAIAAYDAALEQRPGDDDARHNKELLEELLRQQQESQGGGDDQQSEDQESGDDQQRGDSQDAGGQRGEQNDQEQGEGDAAGGDEQDSADQAASDAASDSAAERRQAEQEQADQQPQDSERGDEAAMSAEALSESDAERAQATEQWLRQIPDDPAGLLRRKFQYQYKQRYGKQAYEGDRW
ncbi:MAG: tetratricopeptide repeat protein, partial [Gammaproteobacteria bacterium]